MRISDWSSDVCSSDLPYALDLLRNQNVPVDGLRSKSWDEFAAPGAPPMHFVFTVCDDAAGEICPVWPGQPISAHWGLRSEERRVGKEGVRTGRSRWAPFH